MFIIDKYVLVYAYVPEQFLSRKDLSYLDKLIYIRIVGFCRNNNYNNTCFASNGYFANLFGVKPKAISVTIKKLKDLRLINVKYIKNENRKTTPHTIINYMDYARNAFIFYQIKRENIKQKRKLLISDKYYLVDSGFYFIFNGSTQRNWGQLLENIVFLELIRQGYSITIGKIQDLEVDFVCRKANQIKYIQVSQSILDENTRKREFKSLEKISDSYPKYVISMDSFDFSANGIIHLNIIDFLKSENF